MKHKHAGHETCDRTPYADCDGSSQKVPSIKSRLKVNQHLIQDDVEIIKEGVLALLTVNSEPALVYFNIASIIQSSPEARILDAVLSSRLEIIENVDVANTLPGYAACHLDDIACIRLAAELTIFKGKAVAITTVKINCDTDANFPEIWFDPLNDNIESVDEVLDILKFWFSMFNRDLTSLNVGTSIFYVTEKTGQTLQSTNRWPSNIPKPPYELLKIGQFGMGIISSVLGTPTKNKIEDVGFEVLEKFARVTHFAKDKTTQALEHPLAGPILPLIPEKVRSQFLSTEEAEILIQEYESSQHYLAKFSRDILTPSSTKRMLEEHPQNDTSHDYEALRKLYRSHFTGTPLTSEKWQSWQNSDGLTVSPYLVACTVFCGGIEPQLRKEVWPRILGAVSWKAKMGESFEEKEKEYLIMRNNWMQILSDAGDSSPTIITTPQVGAVGDENDNADVLTKLNERFYRIDKDVVRTDQSLDYFKLNVVQSTSTNQPAPLRVSIDSTTNLKRLRNILMTYTVFNFELGYVQGMNDLCSPLLETLRDEALTFWSYVGLMEKVSPNFNRNQTGMRNQLRQLELLLKAIDPPLYDHFLQTDSANMFCAFRWLLIVFKREFLFEELKTLWEIFWTCPFCINFHLFVAVAILNNARQELFACSAFDEVLKTINLLSQTIVVPEMIQHAEVLYYLFRDRLASDGPVDIVTSLENQLVTAKVETTLSEISGIARSELVLDEIDMAKRGKWLTSSEWLEVLEVLEVNKF